MPTEERGSIGSVKPSGWHTVRSNGVVDGNYLYNRCHLIGFQLSGENANERNLITGTRYLNIDGMLPFENVLNNLHQSYLRAPVVMFFPGTYNEQELILFNEIKDDNYYRAFRLVK